MTPILADTETYKLLHGDALSLLKMLPDESVQTMVTSPPYYLLRNYGTFHQVWGGDEDCNHEWGEEIPGDSRGGSGPSSKEKRAGDEDSTYGRNAPRGNRCKKCPAWRGELGLEPTPDMFIDHLVMVFKEARRVLRKDGTLFLNIADTYASVPFEPWGIKQKDLLGIPHRLVHALQADGWYWRSDGVWSKAGGNCPRCYYRLEKGSTKPEPAKDRFVRAHEAMFMLTKAKTYFFDDEAAKEVHSTAKRRDVFHIASQSFRAAHYAVMPLALAEIGILAGTSEKGACAKCGSPYKRVTRKGEPLREEQKKAGGDENGEYHGEGQKDYEDHGAQDPSELKRRILKGMRKVETLGWKPTCRCACEEVVPCVVLDMFSGAATTGAAALKHGRRYIGLELIESNNTEIAEPRLLATLEARKQTTEIDYLPLESGIYHGKAEILLHRVPPASVRLILTDPPFNVSRENNLHTMGRTGINFEWDGDFDQEAWLHIADKALMPGGSIVIWNDWKVLGFVASVLESMGYDVKRNLTWMKCLSGGTRVYAKTKEGVAPALLKDLVRLRPETVQLWTGQKWSRVLSWSENKEPTSPVEIVLRSGERIKCTANHRWPTKRGLLYADQLRVGDVMTSTRLPAGDDNPSALDDELVGWFVGLYIAEGSRDGHTRPKIQISSHVDETERFEKLERIAKAFHGTLAVHHTRGKAASANLTGRILHAVIDTYVEGRTAYDKHLSSKAWRRSDAFIGGVLAGYLSGDGHFDAKNDRWRLGFTGENKYLANDLFTMCARLGHSLRIKRGWTEFNGRRFRTYRGQLRLTAASGQNAKEDLEILSIRPCRWAGRFWDVEIEDEPHLFALASGVLTHNSNPFPRNTNRSFVQKTECALWAVKPGGKWVFNRAASKSMEDGIFHYPVPRGKKGRDRHESKKPDAMFEELIRILSNPDEVVLDPFCGGGTTAYAAERAGRRHISFDESEKWYREACLHLADAATPALVALARAGVDYVSVEDEDDNQNNEVASIPVTSHQTTSDANAEAPAVSSDDVDF